MFSRLNAGIILFSGYGFLALLPSEGVHLPVQCNPADLKIHYSMESKR